MTKVVSIHSFRGGTGKSNLTANLAASLARTGHRVGIIDTDIQSPGIHVLFGVEKGDVKSSLNDFLAERCGIEEAAIEVGSSLPGTADGEGDLGRIYLVPASMDAGAIAQVLREGYDVSMLAEGVHKIGEALALDTLLIDTHPGLNEETLLAITLSQAMVIVMRPDRQDFQGTAVTVEVARRLEVPQIVLVANNIPASVDHSDLAKQVSEAYATPLAAALPHCDELMSLASGGVLCHEAPEHPWVTGMETVAAQLNGAGPNGAAGPG
jgi:MinD-like ATPase involved in chromosome partitioning or flagellar assembly